MLQPPPPPTPATSHRPMAALSARARLGLLLALVALTCHLPSARGQGAGDQPGADRGCAGALLAPTARTNRSHQPPLRCPRRAAGRLHWLRGLPDRLQRCLGYAAGRTVGRPACRAARAGALLASRLSSRPRPTAVSCYAGAGLVAGTVTAGLGAPEMALACNAAQGLCMTACAGGLLPAPTP